MTTSTTTTGTTTGTTSADDPVLPPSLHRRRAAAICLVLAPLATMTEMATWPVGSDGTVAQQLQSAATSPIAYTVAWLAESIGAVLSLVGVLGLVGYLRGRGRTLAFVGAVLLVGGQVALLTGGGFNAAIVPLAQQPERDVAVRVLDTFNAQPLLPFVAALVWLGIVGTVLVTIAAVRGGLIRWWALVLLAVSIVAVPVLDNDLYGPAAAATALPLTVVQVWTGVALFRTRRAFSPLTAPARRHGAEPVEQATPAVS